MLVYYVIVSIIALLSYILLFRLRNFFPGFSKKTIVMLVLWVYTVSFFLPGVISFLSPVPTFILVFFLIFLGGYFICRKAGIQQVPQEDAAAGGSEDSTGQKGEVAEQIPEESEKERLAGILPLLPKLKVTPAGAVVPVFFESLQEMLMIFPVWREPVFLLSGGVKVQRKEAVSLKENHLDFQGLIDLAFQAKGEKNYPLAMEKFKAALSLAGDVSLKGMIYTELVFLYKETGKYLEGAGLIQGFLLENGIHLSPSLRQHFEKVVQYLQTIDELLKKAEHQGLPFSRIPHLIKIRAEKILQD